MRLLCVVQDERMASSRVRVTAMLPHLAKRGIAADSLPYPDGLGALAALLRRARGYDAVWLQKKLPNWLDALLWRRCPVPVVFDFDDAISFRKDPKRGSYRSRVRERKFRRVLGLAAAVTCGNRYLASLVPARDAGKPTLLYPSPIPTDVPQRDYGAAAGPWVLGWIGGKGNLTSLERIVPELVALRRRHDFVLRVVSDGAFSAPDLAVENVPWSLEHQEAWIAGFDLGLMPLDGASPFDLGKCSYKVLQYMAAGVVPVADAVGMNAEVIRDGATGLLVTQARGWGSVLEGLLCRKRRGLATFGQAAREEAQERFGYEPNAGLLAGFFGGVAARGSKQESGSRSAPRILRREETR